MLWQPPCIRCFEAPAEAVSLVLVFNWVVERAEASVMNVLVWRALSCAVWLTIMMPAGAEEVYRWVDADGSVHFSEQPPPGHDATQLQLRSGSKGSAGSAVQAARPAAAAVGSQTEAKDVAAQREQEAQDERMRVHCANVRSNVDSLRTRPAARYPREDGSYQRYSDEERERMITDAEGFLRDNCQ